MFKVGDKVQRIDKYLEQNSWPHRDKVLTVNRIDNRGYLWFEEIDLAWVGSYFKPYPQIAVSIYLKEDTGTVELDDGRILEYTIKDKPYVPEIGHTVKYKAGTSYYKVVGICDGFVYLKIKSKSHGTVYESKLCKNDLERVICAD